MYVYLAGGRYSSFSAQSLPSPGSGEVPQQKETLGSAFQQQEGIESSGQLLSVAGFMGWSRWQTVVGDTISGS